MDELDLDNSTLLEDVFEQVEQLEKTSEKSDTNNSLGFLEDVALEETNAVLSNKKLEKNKVSVKKSSSTNIIEEVKSLIHKDLTDSSDEEDNKYFEYTRYNECGRNLKNLLKQKSETKNVDFLESPTVTEKRPTPIELLKNDLKKLNGENGGKNSNLLIDPILGMRIVNPLLSSRLLKEKMTGRVSVGTQILKKFLDTPNSKDSNWVTGGAIVNKLNKTSQKGNQYCVWTITDLNGDIKTVSVFLFGSAYKEHWKTSVGTVVGILNPSVMESKERSEATLKVDNAQKILVMGTSKDYGICKSKRKNGENCFSVVNTAKCDFCTYHMKKEYNKACRRSDLQPPKIGRSLDNLRAKVLGKNQVFYGGRTFTAVTGKKSSKQREKDEERLKKLTQRTPLTLSESQTNKDKNILSRLNGGSSEMVGSKCVTAPSEPQKQDLIDLNFTVSKKDRLAAKANALKYVRIHGPIKKTQDDGKIKRTPEQISSLKRKLVTESEETNKKFKSSDTSPSSETNPSKSRLEKNGITTKFLELMNGEVRNKEILKLAETDQREKYFEKLEIREKMETKMASTFKVECKAVRCLKCNYKSFSASDLCKKEKHPLKVVNAIKRFWKCGQCSARTVCLELIPLHSCKTCGSSKWERSSMMPEKKDANLTHEPLSLRGHEEKFLGATIKNASLNLLVPEENS